MKSLSADILARMNTSLKRWVISRLRTQIKPGGITRHSQKLSKQAD
jgi:hypothetical protein